MIKIWKKIVRVWLDRRVISSLTEAGETLSRLLSQLTVGMPNQQASIKARLVWRYTRDFKGSVWFEGRIYSLVQAGNYLAQWLNAVLPFVPDDPIERVDEVQRALEVWRKQAEQALEIREKRILEAWEEDQEKRRCAKQ